MVRIKTGDQLPSQQLNLRVFDDQGNRLRDESNLAPEVSFMFTNLNTFAGRELNKKSSEPHQLNTHTSLIHICFDNVYTDKSWTFNPKDHDVELYVDIKTHSSIAETNYDQFISYFKALQAHQDKDSHQNPHITQEEFDEQIELLKVELNSVQDVLRSSEETLKNLLEQESSLRDVNEAIFETYTTTTIGVWVSILLFGVVQVIFFRYYLKKLNILL